MPSSCRKFVENPMPRVICVLSIFLALVSGCAESTTQRAQRLGSMLTQAGFRMVPANTPTRLQRLSEITPLTMSYMSRNGARSYWFSDPYVCHCIYVGNQQDYQTFEQLKEQESAERRAEEGPVADQASYDQFMASPASQVFYGQ